VALDADNGLVTQKSNILQSDGQGPEINYSIFALYNEHSVPAGRVVMGQLRPGLTPESPEVREVRDGWPGSIGMREGPRGWELFLFKGAKRSERWWLHVLLLLATLFSTVVAGSLLAGHAPILFRAVRVYGSWWLPLPTALDLGALPPGLSFGLALVAILAVHEAGHYFVARYHGISVTPPFFIPFPPYVSIIGTLGAFIRLRSPVLSRLALLDVGVAGPLASFAASLPVLWWGLVQSSALATSEIVPSPYLVQFAGEHFWLGGSVAMSAFSRLAFGLVGDQHVLVLHPIAFAGWLGLFVTALNLLPISQLDGGHILYALMGKRQKPLAWLFFALLIPLGWLWPGWWVWAVLIFAIGRGRIQHPPIFNAELGPTGTRLLLGTAAVLMFVICFVPVPFVL
jgi:hypothetical protein